MSSVLVAQATDQREGFMKALVGDGDDRVLGFTMIGARAGEVMAVVHTAMLAGLSYYASPVRISHTRRWLKG